MKPKILIIEDEEKFARFLEMELTYEGYEVSKAHHGRTGLEMAESGDYDLVLLDVMLPGLSGMEVLRRLRSEGRRGGRGCRARWRQRQSRKGTPLTRRA